MPGSSYGTLGPVAGSNIIRHNVGSAGGRKKSEDALASRLISANNNNNNNNNVTNGACTRGSVASAWHDSSSNLLEKADVAGGGDLQARQMSAYRRWLSRKNKVGQKSRGSDLVRPFNSRFTPKYRETPGAAVILYLGIGMIVVGLVFTFVGLGDKIFRTLELQLIGPSLIVLGFAFCGIRILVCACAGRCSYCDRAIVSEEEAGRRRSSDASLRSWRPSSHNPMDKPPSLQASSAGFVRRPPTPARITLERDDRPDSDGASSSFQDTDPNDLLSIQSEGSSDYSLSEFQEIELQKVAPLPEREGVAVPESLGKLEKRLSDGLILNPNSLKEARAAPAGVTPEEKEEITSEHSWNIHMDTK